VSPAYTLSNIMQRWLLNKRASSAIWAGASLFNSSAPLAQENIVNILADYIWIGGGTLGLILVVVVIVLLLRKT